MWFSASFAYYSVMMSFQSHFSDNPQALTQGSFLIFLINLAVPRSLFSLRFSLCGISNPIKLYEPIFV